MVSGPHPLTLPAVGMEDLVREATDEGHSFVGRFVARWESGQNRFDRPGEAILGLWQGERLIAFGGLNIDPYCDDPKVGRLRHLYVAQAHRGVGHAQRLIHALLEPPLPFQRIRLRAGSPQALQFYDKIGWQRCDEADASHMIMVLSQE